MDYKGLSGLLVKFGNCGRGGVLPLGIAFLGVCRIVYGMFDRAFHRRFALHGGIKYFCLSYLSQLFVLPDINNALRSGAECWGPQ